MADALNTVSTLPSDDDVSHDPSVVLKHEVKQERGVSPQTLPDNEHYICVCGVYFYHLQSFCQHIIKSDHLKLLFADTTPDGAPQGAAPHGSSLVSTSSEVPVTETIAGSSQASETITGAECNGDIEDTFLLKSLTEVIMASGADNNTKTQDLLASLFSTLKGDDDSVEIDNQTLFRPPSPLETSNTPLLPASQSLPSSNDELGLNRHVVANVNDLPSSACNLKCGLCNFSTSSKPNLLLHTRLHMQQPDPPFLCPHCDFRCSQELSLKRHVKKHRDMPFKCSVCSYATAHKSHLNRHARTHTGELPYACNKCAFKCSQNDSLKRHMIQKHTNDKPFKCKICSFATADRSSLIRHTKLHTRSGDSPYNCPDCEYRCNQRYNLKRHMVQIHTVAAVPKPFTCNTCAYTSAYGSDLARHARQVHGEELTVACGECDFRCSQRHDLNTHVFLNHTGTEKPLEQVGEAFEYVSKEPYKLA